MEQDYSNHDLEKEFEKFQAQDNLIYDLLKMLELTIDSGWPRDLSYTIVQKSPIKILIEKIYDAVPKEIQEYNQRFSEARYKEDNLYGLLKHLSTIIDSKSSFLDLIVINGKGIEKIIDKIYMVIPEELHEARKILSED